MILNPKVTIIGCGTVGSILAYKLVLLSLESDSNLKQLYLVDDDSLDDKNLPYISISNHDSWRYVGKPKIQILKSILKNLSPNLDILGIYDHYPLNEKHEIYESLIIDCRDTTESDDKIYMKTHCDGKFASIILHPGRSELKNIGRYSFGNSRFHADSLVTICCHVLYHPEIYNKSETKINILNFNLGFGGGYIE